MAFITSCELWRFSIVTELKDFDSCWSVSHLSFVTCRHLFVIRWGFWIVFFLFRYIEVIFYAFDCNFGRAEDYRSLYRGIRYIEVHYIKVPLRFKLHQASEIRGIFVWFFWLILNLTECNFQWRGICLMVWAHPLTFTLLPFFWSEVAINFFTKQQNSHTINYLEDTLSTYIKVAEFYLLYTYTSESQWYSNCPFFHNLFLIIDCLLCRNTSFSFSFFGLGNLVE